MLKSFPTGEIKPEVRCLGVSLNKASRSSDSPAVSESVLQEQLMRLAAIVTVAFVFKATALFFFKNFQKHCFPSYRQM
jgi:hypothetical protein